MNKQILAVFTILIFALTITGYAYSHWKDTVYMQVTIKTGHRRLIIDSRKLLVPTAQGFNETHPIYYHITSDNHSLIADCQNVTGNWTIKIGLLIKNSGTLPVNLKETEIGFNITDTSQFNITTYYYGTFSPGTNFNFPYWDGIKFDEVPPSGNLTPPLLLDPDYHAITWTIIQYVGDPYALGINVQITATPMDDAYP